MLLFIYKGLFRLALMSEVDDNQAGQLLICLEVVFASLMRRIASMGEGLRTKLVCQAFSFLELGNEEDSKSFLSILKRSSIHWNKEGIEIPAPLSKYILENYKLDFMNRLCHNFMCELDFKYNKHKAESSVLRASAPVFVPKGLN